MAESIDAVANQKAMDSGELYWAFTEDLIAQRRKCSHACAKFNAALEPSRREQLTLLSNIFPIEPLPTPASSPSAEESQLSLYPWVEPPFRCDYGSRISISSNVFINFNCVILDTGLVKIGARTLLGPNVNLYAASHPLDPEVRNGTQGPELGKGITIEEDCWLCGNVTVLQGVTIGKGATVAAGSIVTKDVAPYTVVAGNPAKFMKIADGPAAQAYHSAKTTP